MTMNKLHFLIVLLSFPVLLLAQDLDQKTLAVATGNGSNADAKMDWTVGQTVSLTLGNGTEALFSGIYQPLEVVAALFNIQNLNPQIEIYPNPTVNQINIRSEQRGAISARLFDLEGREIINRDNLSLEQSSLDVSELNNGIYLLHILYDGKSYQYKISKN